MPGVDGNINVTFYNLPDHFQQLLSCLHLLHLIKGILSMASCLPQQLDGLKFQLQTNKKRHMYQICLYKYLPGVFPSLSHSSSLPPAVFKNCKHPSLCLSKKIFVFILVWKYALDPLLSELRRNLKNVFFNFSVALKKNFREIKEYLRNKIFSRSGLNRVQHINN